MLLRETSKKLDNVSIITLKKFNKKYEIAVYPNKLYEYRHNPRVEFNTILHSMQIFRNLSTGEIASEQELSLFGKDKEEILRYILDNGHEQKPKETSSYELDKIEKQTIDLVQNKVLYNGTYVSKNILKGFIKDVWKINHSDPKKQVSIIIRKLEEIGFERVSFKIRCDPKRIELEFVQKLDDGVTVKSDYLHELLDYCEDKGIAYVITKNDEVEEEEIC